MKIVYTRSWKSTPFQYGRPFVPLKDYEELQKKYYALLKQENISNVRKE